MKWMDKPIDHTSDPAPYDGHIARADGRRPFNRYLWPTESWWAYDALGYVAVSGRFHFGIIALNDGRWSISGSISEIEANSDNPHGMWQRSGKPVVFETRKKAIRISVARFIRLCRWARRWEGTRDRLTEENCRKAINWSLEIANRKPIDFRPVPTPPQRPALTGLPIFDYGVSE